MSNPNDKVKNEGESEGESAEGLLDLGINEETDQHKLREIVKEEEKCVQEFLKITNREILEKECDNLALIFSGITDVVDKAKKELTDIQAKTNSKSQQKKEKRA